MTLRPPNAVLERMYRTGQVEDGQGNVVSCFPTSVSYESGALLYEFVREKRPERTLEVGLAWGGSALFICQAHRDNGSGHHTAVDPLQARTYRSVGVLNIERAGLQDVFRFLPELSFDALPRLCAEGERFDFVFIDGRHLFDCVLVDFFYVDRLLEIGGYVALDDLWMPAVRKVKSFILRNRSYELVPLAGLKALPDWQQMVWQRVRRVGLFMLEHRLGRDVRTRIAPANIAILRKTAEDSRRWDFHQPF
jgi:predicted O-methyltransferase YrrM